MAAVMVAGGAFAEQKKTPMDSNSDGKVSKEEFCSAREKMMKKAGREFNRTAVEKQFAAKDKNKDGFLTGEELKGKKQTQEKSGDED